MDVHSDVNCAIIHSNDLRLYAVIPILVVANTHIIQVNPRPYKPEVITYCLDKPALILDAYSLSVSFMQISIWSTRSAPEGYWRGIPRPAVPLLQTCRVLHLIYIHRFTTFPGCCGKRRHFSPLGDTCRHSPTIIPGLVAEW